MAVIDPELSAAGVFFRDVALGDVRLHVAEAGEGPLVVLLHGFPDFWYSWRHQLPALAAAGFRVLAPDLRGYDLSDKPRGLAAYHLDVLAHDVAQLIESVGAQSAAVAGHDWGGIIAWRLAMTRPERVARLAILNAPHPGVSRRALYNPRQLLRSSYVAAFQVPRVPEALIRAFDFAALRRVLRRDPVRPNAFTDADIDRYVEAAGRPEALERMIDYYRALVRTSLRDAPALAEVECPVLVVWGQRDRYLVPELAEPPRRWVSDARVERLADAGHWVHWDRPERVNELLAAFLAPLRS